MSATTSAVSSSNHPPGLSRRIPNQDKMLLHPKVTAVAFHLNCLKESLRCRICLELLQNPTNLPCCGHSICRHCILKWLTGKRSSPCPLCSHPGLTRRSLKQSHLCQLNQATIKAVNKLEESIINATKDKFDFSKVRWSHTVEAPTPTTTKQLVYKDESSADTSLDSGPPDREPSESSFVVQEPSKTDVTASTELLAPESDVSVDLLQQDETRGQRSTASLYLEDKANQGDQTRSTVELLGEKSSEHEKPVVRFEIRGKLKPKAFFGRKMHVPFLKLGYLAGQNKRTFGEAFHNSDNDISASKKFKFKTASELSSKSSPSAPLVTDTELMVDPEPEKKTAKRKTAPKPKPKRFADEESSEDEISTQELEAQLQKLQETIKKSDLKKVDVESDNGSEDMFTASQKRSGSALPTSEAGNSDNDSDDLFSTPQNVLIKRTFVSSENKRSRRTLFSLKDTTEKADVFRGFEFVLSGDFHASEAELIKTIESQAGTIAKSINDMKYDAICLCIVEKCRDPKRELQLRKEHNRTFSCSNIAVVSQDWVWDSVKAKKTVPLKGYLQHDLNHPNALTRADYPSHLAL